MLLHPQAEFKSVSKTSGPFKNVALTGPQLSETLSLLHWKTVAHRL